LLFQLGWTQEQGDSFSIDERYLEDQFYAGVSYNFLVNKPSDVIQRNLSYGLQVGFIKDIPLNSQRNFGIGLGLGYATNSYYSNVLATQNGNMVSYDIPNTGNFNRSKIETHALEFPFELRWRTSNPIDYKFWRIYAGFKVNYLFSHKAIVVSEDSRTAFQNNDVQSWQYGPMLNFGYNTWNIHLYYGLSEFFAENVTLGGEPLQINPLRIGVIFYIL